MGLLGRLDEAASEKGTLDGVLGKTPADAKEGQNSASALLKVASDVLGAQIALRDGKTDQGIHLLTEAAAAADRLRYDEPPDWAYPVRHSLGAALLASGRPAEAEAVYREDLKRNPNNGWSLRDFPRVWPHRARRQRRPTPSRGSGRPGRTRTSRSVHRSSKRRRRSPPARTGPEVASERVVSVTGFVRVRVSAESEPADPSRKPRRHRREGVLPGGSCRAE